MTPDELKARREALSLSQSDLARGLGVPRQHVYRWESGTYRVPPLMEMALRGVAATLLLDVPEGEWIDPELCIEALIDRAKPRRRRARESASRHSDGMNAGH